MVRSSALRSSKYEAKAVGDVVKNRIDAQRDSMASQFTDKAGDLVSVEEDTKAILESHGVSVTLYASYLACARRMYKIHATHEGTVGELELCIEANKWALRGLTEAYLLEICLGVTGVDISTCTSA
jgi:gamma-glutamyl:cysteine ligase YbdK (ATP-grasp superfamily)